jgi:hypothetical protein
MKRYVVGQDRSQSTLFPEVLDDYIAEDNPVRVVDVFVHLKEKVETVKAQMRRLKQLGKQMAKAPDAQISLTDPDARSMAPVPEAPEWSVTTCRPRWIPSITWWSRTR